MIYFIAFIIFSIPLLLVIKPIILNETLIFLNMEDEEGTMTIEEKKKSVFNTLAEIEFDYQMNKLSERDYKRLSDHYRKKAVLILKEEELLFDNDDINLMITSIDDEIEKYKKEKIRKQQ
ncbi:hypothetical protein [Deferribacter abyssi]|uniref:hypothetical protein n=1 Tax=Deferribacter abyssi TaxID=213806 RepID=UPI003C148E64